MVLWLSCGYITHVLPWYRLLLSIGVGNSIQRSARAAHSAHWFTCMDSVDARMGDTPTMDACVTCWKGIARCITSGVQLIVVEESDTLACVKIRCVIGFL